MHSVKLQHLIFSFAFLFGIGTSYAQNYEVGTPVNSLLTNYSYTSFGGCYPQYPDLTINIPNSTVTGVKHALVLASISPDDTLFSGLGDTLNIGDTLYYSPYGIKLYSSSIWTANFDIIAVGTPQIANELYKCGDIMWIDGLTECNNFIYFSYYSNSPTCTVTDTITTPSNVIQPLINSTFSTSDPTQSGNQTSGTEVLFSIDYHFLHITSPTNNAISQVQITAVTGEKNNHYFQENSQIHIDISDYHPGIYFIEIILENEIIRKKIIVGNQF